jgi:high affinity sulfate transporter 1
MTEHNGKRVAGTHRWLPGVSVLRSYERSWLRYDIVAGLVLTTLLVPQGMAYAGLAGLPPAVGLYTTAAGLLAYALFGPSRILVVGPDSTLGPMIFTVIAPLLASTPDPARAIALASTLAVLMGLICLVAGVAKLGTVAELLSKPVRIGYLNGVAIIIICGQLPKLFGFTTGGGSVPRELSSFIRGIYRGDANGPSTAIGLLSVVLIVALRHGAPKLPGVAFVVVGSIVAIAAFDLTHHGVSVIGAVPSGFPSISIPNVSVHDLTTLVLAAAGLAFVTLADTAPISRSFALKRGEHVDPNQEMVAIGAANIAAGLFQGFPISGSASRSAVAEANGARTQVTGVTGAVAIIVILVTFHSALRNLPNATLGAILVAAALSLADVASLRWLWQVRRTELLLSLTATVGVAWLGPLRGIGVAIALAVIDFLRRAWRPNSAVLGRVHGLKGYHDVSRHPGAVQAPGLVLLRFDAPLFFANSDHFAATARQAIDDRVEPIQWLVIAAEPITDVDTTAAEMLTEFLNELDVRGIALAVAEMKGQTKDRLRTYGLFDRIGDDRFFPTIGSAMKAYYQLIDLPNPADLE